MTTNRRQLLALVGAAGAALGGVPALAQDGAPENTFISPCGKPFRAPPGAPYPVATWFAEADQNHDGKLDHGEFLADADAFFNVLDRRGSGVLDRLDIEIYEYRIAPEVLGARVDVQARLWRRSAPGARLWLAQVGGGGPEREPNEPQAPQTLDEAGQGASPFSFFPEPEPVMAADFDVTGFITRANFLKLADQHFASLDATGKGFLTLAGLPKTKVQTILEGLRPHRRRS